MEEATEDTMDKAARRRRPETVSLTDLRTPIVDNILSIIPTGHEKALKYAFYNVIALVTAAVVIFAFWGVYCILEPFIKALLWALLCGSVLHPFKNSLVTFFRSWLRIVRTSKTPFTVHLVTSPLQFADAVASKIGSHFFNFWKPIVGGFCTFMLTYVLYYHPPVALARFAHSVVSFFISFVFTLLSWVNGHVVLALNAAYLGMIIHCVILQRRISEEQSNRRNLVANPTEANLPERSDTTDSPLVQRTTTLNQDQLASNKTLLTSVSYVNWGFSGAYILRCLPIPFLIPFVIFVTVGGVAYFRSRSKDQFKYSIPKFSRYAALMVLKIGTPTASASRIMSPRLSVDAAATSARCSSTPIARGSKSEATFLESPANAMFRKLKDKDPMLKRSVSTDGPMFSGLGLAQQKKCDTGPSDSQIANEFPSPSFYTAVAEDEVDGLVIDSNKFLYGVMVACVLVQIWNHLWLLHLLPIPVFYCILKKFCFRFGIFDSVVSSLKTSITRFYFETEGPSRYLFPEPVRVVFRILYIADKKLVTFCEGCLDPVAASIVLVVVVLATVLGVIFAATQVYGEGDHLVRVGVSVINSTVSQHPEINEVLPEGWQTIMDSMVSNAYVYGREYITNLIRDSIAEKTPEKAEQIEKQVIELWDRVYLAWNQTWNQSDIFIKDKNNNVVAVTVDKEGQPGFEWNDLLATGRQVPNLVELSDLATYAKSNIGTLWTVCESVWNVLVGNISLAMSAITAVLSFLFGSGTAILNLIINLVVFFTALFYLLNSSSDVYKPVELFSMLTPGAGTQSSAFAVAVEDAISGVFVASFKMATFYGMWTWLIHSLFQVNIVFLPSMIASLFGAVPFLAPYWAALPAVLDLWLIQGQWTKALLMLLAQMAPMSIVDTQIYSEIKGGGHPYLTGLAVAGGIFYFGMQGAIMGPVVLCCVVVAVKVGSNFLREMTDEPDIAHPRHPSSEKDGSGSP